jgi:uncharacterized protein (DUF433 family)
MRITRNDEILGGEPRTGGSRVAVRHAASRVIDHGSSPAHVADQFDDTKDRAGARTPRPASENCRPGPR